MLVLLGIASFSGFLSGAKSAGGGIPELSRSERREANKWITQIESSPGENHEAAVEALVNLGPGVAPAMIPLLKRGRTDVPALKVLERLSGDPHVQTLLVEALTRLDGVEGRAEFVRVAVSASSPAITGFRLRQAQLFAAYHEKGERLARFSPMLDVDMGGIVATTAGGQKVFLVPADHIAWTRPMASFITAMFDLRWKRGSAGASTVLLAGTVSPMAYEQLEARRMMVRTGVEAELM